MFRIPLRHSYGYVLTAVLLAVSLCAVTSARAEDNDPASVAELQQRVKELETVVRQMQQARLPDPAPMPTSLPAGDPAATSGVVDPAATSGIVDPANPSNAAASPQAQMGASGPNFPNLNKGFAFQSADGTCQLRITGQLQADFRGYLDPVDTSTTANNYVAGTPTTGSPDEFLIRRARLGIEADMDRYYEFRLLPDFAGTSIAKSITDGYMNVHYWDEFQFEAGKFKQPFSYEDLIQDRYVPTLERSMIDQLVPQRDEGVMIHGERLFAGAFDYAVAVSNGDSNDSTLDNNDHKDFNGRIVFHPFHGSDGCDALRYLSVGLSGGVGTENEPLSTSSSTPPTLTTPSTVTWFAFNSNYVSSNGTTQTNPVIANGVRDRISPELTWFYHSLGFASQWYQEDQQMQLTHGTASSKAAAPLVDVQFEGFYFLTSYLLTGEERTDYSQQIDPLHPFDPASPLASPGAWEFVARAERMEVGESAFAGGLASDRKTPANGSINNALNNASAHAAVVTTSGFNWYLNKWVRAQCNWEHAEFDGKVKIGNTPVPFSKEDALYTRFQVIF